MATPRQIHALHSLRPFQSFHLRLGSGLTFEIADPENIVYGMKGHEIAVYDQDEFHLLDMNLVEVVELVPVAESKTEGSGA
jgi:hypothetical protein